MDYQLIITEQKDKLYCEFVDHINAKKVEFYLSELPESMNKTMTEMVFRDFKRAMINVKS